MATSEANGAVRFAKNRIEVSAGFFDSDTDYTVQCKAAVDGRTGVVQRRYTTKPFKFDFKFGVNPYQGVLVDTVFHLWVDKTPESLMDCEFGYENDRGEVRIDAN